MNTQNPIVRRLLPLALACGLLAVLTPAAQAQGGIKNRRDIISAGRPGCGDLLVVITGTSASQVTVNCRHAYSTKYLPATKAIDAGKPAIITLEQSLPYGPDCTLSVTGGGDSAVLTVQQNFCTLEAGTITASVTSGNATRTGSVEGSYADSIPGIVWFKLGF